MGGYINAFYQVIYQKFVKLHYQVPLQTSILSIEDNREVGPLFSVNPTLPPQR